MQTLVKRTVTEEFVEERDAIDEDLDEADNEDEGDGEDLDADESPKRAARRKRYHSVQKTAVIPDGRRPR